MKIKTTLKQMFNKLGRFINASWPVLIAIVPLSIFVVSSAQAATPPAGTVDLSAIAHSTGTSMTYVAGLLEDVSLIAGIGFIMASFFKFHQHKLNPQQVPVSQGITLLLVGGGLTIFPALLPVGGKAIAGSNATFGSLTDAGGTNITKLLKNTA